MHHLHKRKSKLRFSFHSKITEEISQILWYKIRNLFTNPSIYMTKKLIVIYNMNNTLDQYCTILIPYCCKYQKVMLNISRLKRL